MSSASRSCPSVPDTRRAGFRFVFGSGSRASSSSSCRLLRRPPPARLGASVVRTAVMPAVSPTGGARAATAMAAASSGSQGVATRVELRGGDEMPVLGLGTWKMPKASCADLVRAAVETGWRHLDCACDYGNEAEVGKGMRDALQAGVCAREDLWVTSKLWNTYHRREHVRAACERSMSDLGVDYLDLYLVHFPISLKFVPFETRYPPEWVHDPEAADEADRVMVYDRVPIAETWGAMEELVDAGLVKNIGVCNFNVSLLTDLLANARVPPAVLQIESHPFLTQDYLIEFAQKQGVHVTAFSPLGAASYVEMGWTKAEEGVLHARPVTEAAAAHGVTPGQVLLRWGVQRGTSCIPKTTRRERLRENVAAAATGAFELTEAEMKAISALDKNLRYNDPAEFCKGMGGPCPIYN